MQAILSFALLLALLSGAYAAATAEIKQPRCSNLCAVCQSLMQAEQTGLCSDNLLTPCSCSQFAVQNTSHSAECDKDSRSSERFCVYGQVKDPKTGCPSTTCSLPAQCPSDWHQKCPAHLWCPQGHQMDSSGCPSCSCSCQPAAEAAAACAATCQSRGLQYEMVPPQRDSDCPTCECRGAKRTPVAHQEPSSSSSCQRECSNSCGPHGHKNLTADASGCIADCSCRCPGKDPWSCPADCAVTWQPDQFGCDICRCDPKSKHRWCPMAPPCKNNCGPHGYRVTGTCRTDCVCACPPPRCPSDCAALRWDTDEFGCAVCNCAEQQQQPQCPQLKCSSTCGPHSFANDSRGCPTCRCQCPATSSQCPSTSCARWSHDAYGCKVCSVCKAEQPCVKADSADIRSLCPTDCTNFELSTDSKGCLSCSCKKQCPKPPTCLVGCGRHPRRKNADGCITDCGCDCQEVSASSCDCPDGFTIVEDAYGCPSCKCNAAKRCPMEPHCSNNCGQLGYVADAAGCRVNCNCNCPSRRCSCTFGSKVDEFNCPTCQCNSAADIFQLF